MVKDVNSSLDKRIHIDGSVDKRVDCSIEVAKLVLRACTTEIEVNEVLNMSKKIIAFRIPTYNP